MILSIIAENELELCYKALEMETHKKTPIVPHTNALGNAPRKDMTLTMTMTCFGKEEVENATERYGGRAGVCRNVEKCKEYVFRSRRGRKIKIRSCWLERECKAMG